MIRLIILILFNFVLISLGKNLTFNDTSSVVSYLSEYGYLNLNTSEISQVPLDVFRSALKIFQEYNSLPIDGELNEETLNLIKKRRCGVPDDISYSLYYYKWKKSVIKWRYVFANPELHALARAAFDAWSRKTNLIFMHDLDNPDIVIMNTRLTHKKFIKKGLCSASFSGKGGALAHADYPNKDGQAVEIHIDQDEDFYYELNNRTGDDKVNLYKVLLHEIGHALGISHSLNQNAIMYAQYMNGYELDLDEDDVLAIQSLYGVREKEEEKKEDKSAEKGETTTPPETEQPVIKPSLCDLEMDLNTFLIANRVMYIFHEKWVWLLDLENTFRGFQGPISITDWLTFLPNTFSKIDAIYQRPSGEVVIFVDGLVYMIGFPSIELKQGFPKRLIDLGYPRHTVIQAAVNTYSGRTYVFFSNDFVIELNECEFRPIRIDGLSRVFPQLPPGLTSAFRYTNGFLYFFRDRNYFEFNEFNNTLTKAGMNTISLFGIHCRKQSVFPELISNLKNIIHKLEGNNSMEGF